MGNSSWDGEVPKRRFQGSTAAVTVGTIGVLLTKALGGPEIAIRRAWVLNVLFDRPSTQSPIHRIAPVVLSAATSTNSTATVNTPGFQNPVSASAGVSTPLTISAPAAATNTRSGLKRSHSNIASVPTITATGTRTRQPISPTTN